MACDTLLQLAFVGNLEYGCENVNIHVIGIGTGGGGKITLRFQARNDVAFGSEGFHC